MARKVGRPHTIEGDPNLRRKIINLLYEPNLSRRDIARKLNISLATLQRFAKSYLEEEKALLEEERQKVAHFGTAESMYIAPFRTKDVGAELKELEAPKKEKPVPGKCEEELLCELLENPRGEPVYLTEEQKMDVYKYCKRMDRPLPPIRGVWVVPRENLVGIVLKERYERSQAIGRARNSDPFFDLRPEKQKQKILKRVSNRR